MNKQKSTYGSYSLIMITKRLFFMAIPILIIGIIISTLSIINIKEQNQDSIQNSVSLYQDSISTKLKAIEHFILWSIVNEPLIENIEDAHSQTEYSRAIQALQARVSDSQYATGNEYQYFLYLDEKNLFFNASDLNMPYQHYLYIKNTVMELFADNMDTGNSFSWQAIFWEDTAYLGYIVTYLNRTFAVFIDTADLASPLENINLGENGTLIFTDPEGKVLFPYAGNANEQRSSNPLFYNSMIFTGSEHSLPFDILVYSDNFSNYGGMLFWQLFICITALGLSLILCSYMLYLYFKVIKPIKEFSEGLSAINEQEEFINLQSNNIRELEQASIQFKNLIHEIKKLKIRIYEQELDKKKFQIAFLQKQIRPHFYLNCLTTISSMAQLNKTKDIQAMVLVISRYLHYLFQTDKEMIRIKYELQHIQAYLDIQAMRYGPIFTHQCTISSEDENALIPPLLLITFVENSIKHSESADGQLQIVLNVVRQQRDNEDYLKIDITDSGQGFPEEMLANLSNGNYINMDDSSHVGIRNSMKRLRLLYGINHGIDFFNEKPNGAHIQLLIPYQIQED